MTREVRPRASDETSVRSLVPYTDLVDISNDRLCVKEKIEIPTDEFGLPIVSEFVSRVVGSVAISHHWGGRHDLHHLMWPRRQFKAVVDDNGYSLGANFRSTASMKIWFPRQLHEYWHLVTPEPIMPDPEVMRQMITEQDTVNRLYHAVRLANLSEFDISEEKRDEYRRLSFRQKIDKIPEDGWLGLLPPREELYDMDMDTARMTLRALARVRGYSNAGKCKKRFYRHQSAWQKVA